MAQKWSILDQKWPNMAGLSTLQSGPKGPKRDQNGQPKCFRPFGTLLGPSGPFWTISNKKLFFAPRHLLQTLLCPFGAKSSFLYEMIQKGPDGQTTRQTLIYVFLRAPDCWHPLTRVNKTLLCISSLSSRPAAS